MTTKRVEKFTIGLDAFIVKFKGATRSCDEVRPVTVKVILKAKGVRYGASLAWCNYVGTGLNAWEESGGFFEDTFTSESQTLWLTPNPDSTFLAARLPSNYRRTLTFGYWVSIGGKLARSGRLQVNVHSYLRTIYEGEDDFINICIDDAKRLYSSGGRLYCFDQEVSSSMKLLR